LAVEHEGVVPDMITIAKGLTSGYATLGAVLVHERVAQHFDEQTLYAGLTGYAHPLACAAGLAALGVYREDGLIERAAALGLRLTTILAAMREKHESAVVVRNRGLLGAIELDFSAAQFKRFGECLNEQRVLTHLRPAEKTVIVSPPLCMTEAELDDGMSRIGAAIREAAN
ncbi:MAG: aspartate aminotransferase family protein, partial [Myxococcales bacterium]|nr:aspartate aminotransferase family protein [Myxococcales bacterium]